MTLSKYVYGRTRRRLDGLTEDEYLWEPVPDCWSVRPDASGVMRADHAVVHRDPPFTTIAWRLWHLVGGYGMARNARWLGLSPRHSGFEQDDPAPANAAEAISMLERAYASWHEVLTTLGEDKWAEPLGPMAGLYAEQDKASLVLHQIDEQIHHGAELGVLRATCTATGTRDKAPADPSQRSWSCPSGGGRSAGAPAVGPGCRTTAGRAPLCRAHGVRGA